MNELVHEKPKFLECKGRFKIDADFIRVSGDGILEVMKHMAIVKAEMIAMTNEIEYMAYSYLFRPIADGEIIPEYSIYVSYEDDICEVGAIEINA